MRYFFLSAYSSVSNSFPSLASDLLNLFHDRLSGMGVRFFPAEFSDRATAAISSSVKLPV